jgi:glycogen synthase
MNKSKIKKMVFTGKEAFTKRRQGLFTAISQHYQSVEIINNTSEWYERKPISTMLKVVYALRVFSFNKSKLDCLHHKNQQAFIMRSLNIEGQIRQMKYPPDIVFHIFSMSSPFWENFDIPFAMYLDYTMALSEKNWTDWAFFMNSKQRNAWIECEQKTYERARHIFVMSSIVKNSLVEDYGINHQKITVVGVGASLNFSEHNQGKKIFGSKQLLFNSSDFFRKGGDIVLEAFIKVKKMIPDAKLVVIGKKLNPLTIRNIDGVENIGKISSSEKMKSLFMETDLVIAPARCEPFGIFLLDAMTHGVPCVINAGNGNGMPEFLENWLDGVVIPQLDPELLADNIIKLLNNPDKLSLMSEAAIYKMQTKFNWDNIAKEIVDVLEHSTSLEK